MNYNSHLCNTLALQTEQYLREHPNVTLSDAIQFALNQHLEVEPLPTEPRDLSPLLELAGLIKDVPSDASERAEDEVA